MDVEGDPPAEAGPAEDPEEDSGHSAAPMAVEAVEAAPAGTPQAAVATPRPPKRSVYNSYRDVDDDDDDDDDDEDPWEEVSDEGSGQKYYHNKITGQTAWTKPGELGDPDAPDEWEEMTDDATGKPYWFNAHTGESVWEDPNKASVKMGATMLFAFTASKEEEISVTERESVVIVGGDDGSGWIRIKTADGRHGFVPLSYLEVEEVSC